MEKTVVHNSLRTVSGHGKVTATSPYDENVALAADVFDHFCSATTLKSILGLHRHMCDLLKLRPTNLSVFYPKIKSKLRSWKAQALWKRLDIRANHKCYNRGRSCIGTRVLVIGAGPCGLRAAIECQLLGAKVVVIEKRDRLSRNNVLHLWPFVIHDLRALGAKKFFGKFCAGAIDHISIRQLQCILLKVALLLGVEIHEGVGFESLVEPTQDECDEKIGWHATVSPPDHPVSHYEFDVLIGADGKRNTLDGFKRKEFRGKLAIAITANFINKHTEAEARVQEISGVAFIFNQKFFKDLYHDTGIDLENIVYYKDETHYFVMTAKKHSLIDKGVILQDLADTAKLLAPDNVDRQALMKYAREAAEFSTNYQMPNLEFAVNHYGQPDVAMFDFTSMYAAENASRIVERKGYRLFMCLVGDSLLEPFWPTGSGCARGFLSCLDACWAIRAWGTGTVNPLEVLAERESIYRLLGQTTPENLQRDYAAYTLCPSTRYPNLNRFLVTPIQVRYLYDTDNIEKLEMSLPLVKSDLNISSNDNVHKKKRKRDMPVHPDTLLHWIQKQVAAYSIKIENITSSFKNGLALCAIIHRYRPELVDWSSLKSENVIENNQLAFDLLEKEMGIPPVMTGVEMANCSQPDKLTMLSYLSHIYETFHGEIPQTIKHLKIDMKEIKKEQTKSDSLSWKLCETGSGVLPIGSSNIGNNPSGSVQQMSRSSSGKQRLSHLSAIERRRKRRNADKVSDRDRYHDYRNVSGTDENFAGRVKNIEKQFHRSGVQEKKPPDLLRAIGKIESSDWNIREIEKKIMENKLGKNKTILEKERVPKWNREQFAARQAKMEKKSNLERSDSVNEKYVEIDKSLKKLDKKLKEGTILEQGPRGNNKVASMAEHFDVKSTDSDSKNSILPKSNSKSALNLPTKGGSEICHFCGSRVYLMERLSAEGRFFHRGCFRCQYCSINLRLGFYVFDAQHGNKFYCPQHAGMQGKTRNIEKSKSVTKIEKDTLDSKSQVAKGHTPERIEFANLVLSGQISENEEPPSQIDEDEWTDRNFGQSTAELDSSDLSDSDSDDLYEEALERAGEVAFNLNHREDDEYVDESPNSDNCEDSSDDESSYYDYSSDADGNDSVTDEEELKLAREIRRREFNVQERLIPADTDTTGSDTEVVSDEESESSEESHDSATEISTDSEFKLDGTTPTLEIPPIMLNDIYITKSRGSYNKNNQNRSHVKQQQASKKLSKNDKLDDIHLEITPIVPDIATLAPKILNSQQKCFHLLNRTHSTEGIASKVSLELKKQYLLGTPNSINNIQKSGSASMLDSKLKSFHSNISEHQKLLNPSPSVSPTVLNNQSAKPRIIPTTLSPTQESKTEQSSSNKLCCLNAQKSDSENDNVPKAAISITDSSSNIKSIVSSQTDDTITQQVTVKPVTDTNDIQETSIIVPNVTWHNNKVKTVNQHEIKSSSSFDDVDTDSLSSFDANQNKQYQQLSHSSSTPNNNLQVPKLQINDRSSEDPCEDDIPLDSLQIVDESPKNAEINTINISKREPKCLNQPKPLEASPVKLLDLHNLVELKLRKSSSDVSLTSSETSNQECTAAVLTETELSDWARDENVSDDLDDVDIKIDHKVKLKLNKSRKVSSSTKLDEIEHVCGRKLTVSNQNSHITDLDSIEYMDTGSEESGFDNIASATNHTMLKNQGYVKFINVEQHPLSKSYFSNDLNNSKTIQNNAKECDKPTYVDNSIEYIEHVTRLQNKITEFGNVRDSIDVRKSRSKSKSSTSPSSKSENSSPRHLLKESNDNQQSVSIPPLVVPIAFSPNLTTSEKLKEITKERAKQKNLIHELVMDKLRNERKLQRKSKVERHEQKLYDLQKSSTDTVLVKSLTNKAQLMNDKNNEMLPSRSSQRHSVVFQSDVSNKNNDSISSFHKSTPNNDNFVLSAKTSTPTTSSDISLTVASSKKPNRTKSFSEISRESLSMCNIKKSVSGHMLSGNVNRRDVKSCNSNMSCVERATHFKSEPCLVEKRVKSSNSAGSSSTGSSDKRKSIIQAVTDFFHKRRDSESTVKTSRSQSTPCESSSAKERFSIFRISPKSKDKTKSKVLSLTKVNSQTHIIDGTSGNRNRRSLSIDNDAPPIPPLPPLEQILRSKVLDEKFFDVNLQETQAWSTDTLDRIDSKQQSADDINQRKYLRRSQHRRLRIAQEIQRKLEETEVKTRELESRGVELEKILRGEDISGQQIDESALLAEWLTLMRELAALRRYERELSAQAEDIRLEEHHLHVHNISAGNQSHVEAVIGDSAIIDKILDINAKRKSLSETSNQRNVKEDDNLDALIASKNYTSYNSERKSPNK